MACVYLGGVSLQTNSVIVDPLVLLAKWLPFFSENLLQQSSESPVGSAASSIDLWWDINKLIQPKVFSESYLSVAGVSSGQIDILHKHTSRQIQRCKRLPASVQNTKLYMKESAPRVPES